MKNTLASVVSFFKAPDFWIWVVIAVVMVMFFAAITLGVKG